MPKTFLHGVEVVEIDTGPRPIRTVRSSVIGVVGTAPDADPLAFPLNTPVLIAGSRAEAARLDVSAAGTRRGTLPDALDGIFDQIGAVVVVVRVEAGATDAETVANVLGGVDAATGQYEGVHALLGAESSIGVSPRILIAPGFTGARAANGIAAITVSTPGAGYTDGEHLVTITGAGAGAEIYSTITGGSVTATRIAKPGSGYSTPVLNLPSSAGDGTGATITGTVATVANMVTSELLGIAERLRAVIIADGPNQNDQAALAWAGDFGSPRVYVVDPGVIVAGTDGAPEIRPASPRVAGLIAKVGNDQGFWHSPSNKVINGIVGTARPVDFKMGDANSRANLLNEQNVGTIIRYDGFRLWGNRSLSSDPKWTFLPARRTADMINESLQQAHLWAVDRNITKTYLQDVSDGVNAYMATYFPALGAAYQGLGQSGTDSVADLAAALQVVRKGTGDASGAATNLQNVLQKIYAPDTVARFKKHNVDLFAEMQAAAERGLTPIEAIAELTDRTLGGDMSKMGNLFGDDQVQAGMRSLIQGMEEYRDILEQAMNAKGVMSADYDRRVRTAAGAQARWNATLETLNITIGAALLPVMSDLMDAIIPVVEAVGRFAEANPQLTSSIITTVGALIAFKGALSALKFVGLLGKGGALQAVMLGVNGIGKAVAALAPARKALIAFRVAAQLGGVGPALLSVGRAALALLNPLRLVGMALRAVGLGFMANPIGAAVAAISGAAYLIYRNWDNVGPWFGRMWDSVKIVFDGFGDFVAGVFTGDMGRAWDGLKQIWNGVKGYYKGLWDGVVGVFTWAWDSGIKPVLDKLGILNPVIAAWEGFKSAIGAVIDWISRKFDALMSSIKPVLDALTAVSDWAVEKAGAVGTAINSLNGSRDGPISTGPYTGGATGPIVPGQPVPGYAVGGSFGRGLIQVGERGPELRFENRAGFIATHRRYRELMGMASQVALPPIADRGDDLFSGLSSAGASAPAPAASSSSSLHIDPGAITIIAQPGQSPREIAQMVMSELQRLSRGALYDQG